MTFGEYWNNCPCSVLFVLSPCGTAEAAEAVIAQWHSCGQFISNTIVCWFWFWQQVWGKILHTGRRGPPSWWYVVCGCWANEACRLISPNLAVPMITSSGRSWYDRIYKSSHFQLQTTFSDAWQDVDDDIAPNAIKVINGWAASLGARRVAWYQPTLRSQVSLDEVRPNRPTQKHPFVQQKYVFFKAVSLFISCHFMFRICAGSQQYVSRLCSRMPP